MNKPHDADIQQKKQFWISMGMPQEVAERTANRIMELRRNRVKPAAS